MHYLEKAKERESGIEVVFRAGLHSYEIIITVVDMCRTRYYN